MSYNIFSEKFEINSKGISSVFDAIVRVCESLQIPFFVVGAFARDIVMQHIHNFSTIRKTKDIDIAVMVENWETYEKVKIQLINNYGFKVGTKKHELISNMGIYIDLIPFGNIEENNKVSWPPHFNFMMNMIGYQEVYRSAIPVLLDKKYNLLIASLEGLVLLKLIAWNDRKYLQGEKHIRDIILIIDHYFLIYFFDLVEKYPALFDTSKSEMDDTLIAAEALGRNISVLIKDKSELSETVLSILETNLKSKDSSLLIQSLKNASDFDYPYCIQILEAFCNGIKYNPTT
ncbi:MAG: hypothetical protein AB8B69_00750 [Chitinophagales bacterium]